MRLLKWSGIGGLIVGGLALIPGAVLIAIHGKNSQDPTSTQDRRVYDTKVGGAILAGFGTAALIGGAVLLSMAILRGRRQERPGQAQASLPLFTIGTPRNGRGVVLHGRFQF